MTSVPLPDYPLAVSLGRFSGRIIGLVIVAGGEKVSIFGYKRTAI
jgi:hypothetical protein